VPEQNAGDSRERIRRFTFDFCFHENSTQDDVFESVESVVSKAIKGRYHSCVLAYGQSSSGKTHTMMGFPHDPGLTPRLCQQVFSYLEEMAVRDETLSGKIAVSYLEIYNEKVRDLLYENEKCLHSPSLKIRQHPKKGPYVQGLTEHTVTDSASLLQLLEAGNSNRRVAATITNLQSSRSHSVFVITFDDIKLTLVDLAGSERAGNRCYSTSRFREGANINKSLVALGNVISALAEDAPKISKGIRKRFIPYRDSVLTWLLKDTLGGNSDTLMIATISPSSKCYSETVNTLRFGQRAKLIISIPVVNEDSREKTIRELRAEIARLKEFIKLGRFETVSMSKNQNNDSLNTTEKLIPVMSFTDTNGDKPVPSRLRRTFSVDHPLKKMESAPSRKFGSEETINKTKKLPLRISSVDKKIPETKRQEKSIVTEPKLKVEAKVDSIRRTPIKPRSQIVAAVTHRLYAKTKKREAATDTSDMPTSTPSKELTICANARQQLRELTRKAVRAQRIKNEETQTDLFPVLRVKEMSTDVDDLKISLYKVKNAETSTGTVQTEDKEISCTFLDSLKNAFVVTRSCGTQSIEKLSNPSTVSFTKYLHDVQEPRLEIFNPHTANPIYTNSVNINISHNYINGQRASDSVSDDSLDDQNNVCLPTPDLISNHNSLEPHAHATTKESLEIKIRHANCAILDQDQFEVNELVQEKPTYFIANCLTTPRHQETLNFINIPSVYVSEVYIVGEILDDHCQSFSLPIPEIAKPNIIEYKSYSDDCIKLIEPLVLKSIMKHIPECKKLDSSEEFGTDTEPPDSLEYHMNNSKKVRFSKTAKSQNERMLKAMSGFLEEATILMNNLTMAASKLEQEQEYDVQVTINGLDQKRKQKRKKLRSVQCQTEERRIKSDYIQTEPTSSQMDDFEVPVNKYELLLEDSCRRLEKKIATATEDGVIYNPWNVSVHGDSSIESNPVTFSDYGSLPRRRKSSSCTPSAYLRQLTTMRRRVVEASREELSNNSESSLS
ncbi:kinesin-II 85 kDa subunit-like, partial [Asbolus verrucosus]